MQPPSPAPVTLPALALAPSLVAWKNLQVLQISDL